MPLYRILLTLFCIFSFSLVSAQTFSAKVIDKETEEPISFASIETGKNQGVITNEEGEFTFIPSQVKFPQDSIYISSMGYEKKGIFLSDQVETVIFLEPKTIELKQVFLSTKILTANEIIEKVKENLDANYSVDLTRKKIFFRQSDFNQMNKIDFGFKKSSIPELNEALMDSISGVIPKRSSYYKEVAGDFYGDYSKQKLFINKAAELYDKSLDISAEGVGKEMERIFYKNVKPNSYLKIKSGIFSTKMQVDSIIKENEEAKEAIEKKTESGDPHFQKQIKNRISYLYGQLFFNEDSKIDVLDKSNRYQFSLDNVTVIDDMSAYVINFSPKGKKDFKGVLYVNIEDFAIVRMDFVNIRPISKFGLLGMTYRNNIFRGKMLFGKDLNGAYSPRYVEVEDGSFFAIDRPLKVIEKNKHVKGRRKQNELSLQLDIQINQLEKFELVVFESENISNSDFEDLKENENIKATYLSQYDPTFWKDYTIMEPNEAIESFKVVE